MPRALEPINALVADADPSCRALLHDLLTRQGISVHTAENSRQALQLIRQYHPQLIITEVSDTEMDGLELCRQIRSIPAVQAAYLIISATDLRSKQIEQCMGIGVDDFLQKPFIQNELTIRLRLAHRITRLESQHRRSVEQLEAVAGNVEVTSGRIERLAVEVDHARNNTGHRDPGASQHATIGTSASKSAMSQQETQPDFAAPLCITSSSDPLISTLANDADMIGIIELFVQELPVRIKSIHEALVQNDLELIKRLAHQLKGAAGGYGYALITEAAKGLESSVKTFQDLSIVRRDIETLSDLCARACAGTNHKEVR